MHPMQQCTEEKSILDEPIKFAEMYKRKIRVLNFSHNAAAASQRRLAPSKHNIISAWKWCDGIITYAAAAHYATAATGNKCGATALQRMKSRAKYCSSFYFIFVNIFIIGFLIYVFHATKLIHYGKVVHLDFSTLQLRVSSQTASSSNCIHLVWFIQRKEIG